MGQVVDFQKYVENRAKLERAPSRCPVCYAPTMSTTTSGGTPLHIYEGTDMEAYWKLRALLTEIVDKLLETNLYDDLVDCFGEAFEEFMEELENGR